jgi:hypothetical protein
MSDQGPERGGEGGAAAEPSQQQRGGGARGARLRASAPATTKMADDQKVTLW